MTLIELPLLRLARAALVRYFGHVLANIQLSLGHDPDELARVLNESLKQ